MYLYYNKQGVLKEVSKNPIRQGDSFDLYVLFDKDVTFDESVVAVTFYRPGDEEIASLTLFSKTGEYKTIEQKDSFINFAIIPPGEYAFAHVKVYETDNVTNRYGVVKAVLRVYDTNLESLNLATYDENDDSVTTYRELIKIASYLGNAHFYVEPTREHEDEENSLEKQIFIMQDEIAKIKQKLKRLDEVLDETNNEDENHFIMSSDLITEAEYILDSRKLIQEAVNYVTEGTNLGIYVKDGDSLREYEKIIRKLKITDATATSDKILLGEVAYNNQGRVVGIIPNYDGTFENADYVELVQKPTGILTVTENKEYDVSSYEKVLVRVNDKKLEQTKTVEPRGFSQIIYPDNNETTLSSVEVLPVPNHYVIPSGSREIRMNGSYDISNLEKVNVDIRSEYEILVKDDYLTIRDIHYIVDEENILILGEESGE